MNIHYFADSHVGLKREVNQDSFGNSDPDHHNQHGFLSVVCDGMGGHAAGEVASRLGVDVIVESYQDADPDEDRSPLLRRIFVEANSRIYQEGQGSMGTTGVAALIHNNRLYIANVGDSRAYIIRNGSITQITNDHSLVAEQVLAGLLTPEQARSSNYRNMITRALGYRNEVQVDIFLVDIHDGDRVLLSSDGLHGLVEDAELARVASAHPPEESVRRLIDMANERGGTDNITVSVIVIEALDPNVATAPLGPGAEHTTPDAETRPRIIAIAEEQPSHSAETAPLVDNSAPPTSPTSPTSPTRPLSSPAATTRETARLSTATRETARLSEPSPPSPPSPPKQGGGMVLALVGSFAVVLVVVLIAVFTWNLSSGGTEEATETPPATPTSTQTSTPTLATSDEMPPMTHTAIPTSTTPTRRPTRPPTPVPDTRPNPPRETPSPTSTPTTTPTSNPRTQNPFGSRLPTSIAQP